MAPDELLGDRYRLIAQRGLGGTSVVWQAYDELLGRDVAVKLLASDLAGDAALVGRLRDEAQAAARLPHPHVVAVYDFGRVARPGGQAVPYVVLELVEGQSLSDLLGQGPLPWRDAVRVAAQVASALAAAHARGIVHRDVKPDNVMLTEGGAKLLDFGISAIAGETDVGPDGELLCTPAYLAPERLDTGPVRPAFDVYGLGLLLYKSLTGELPWRWEQMPDLLAAHRHVEPAPLPALAGLPAEVAELCRRCLAKRPADRPTSGEVARVLASAVDTGTQPGDPPEWTRHPVVGRPLTPTAAEPATTGRLATGRLAAKPHRVLAWAAAGVTLAGVLIGVRTADVAGLPPDPGAGSVQQPVACQVRYELRRDSGSEFTAGITLTNTGTGPVRDWRLDFAFPADQRVVRSSAGVWQQSGQSVAVEGGGPAATLPAGQSVILGFEGSYRDGNPLPTEFHLNGSDCTHLLTASNRGTGSDPAQAGSAATSRTSAGQRRDAPSEEDGDRGRGEGAENGNGPGSGEGNGHREGGGPGRH